MRQPYTYRPWTGPMVEHVEQHDRCAVFAAMGAGKTGACLKAADSLELIDPGPSLILCPKLVGLSTWPNEVAKWDFMEGRRIIPLIGSADQVKRRLKDDTADFYTVNYERLPWLIDYLGDNWPWHKVVADELTKLKSFRLRGQGTERAGAFGRVAWSKVRRFVGLTGTPAPNGLKDLWGQMWFVDKGERLGRTKSGFDDRWFQRAHDGFGKDPLPFAQDQIQAAIRDICLTVDPADYIAIDKPIVTKLEVELDARSLRYHKDMQNKMFVELKGLGIETQEIEAVNAAARSIKCLQISSGFLFTDDKGAFEEIHTAKLDMLETLIDEANGMPVVVAYHFVPDLKRLKKRFPYAKTIEDLGTNVEKEWNSGRHRLLLAHPASLGHGLNLQDAGNILCFYGLWWDLEQHQQIIERIGPLRQFQAGHPRPVYNYYLLAKGTLDEVVFERLMSKKSVQDCLLDAMRRS